MVDVRLAAVKCIVEEDWYNGNIGGNHGISV